MSAKGAPGCWRRSTVSSRGGARKYIVFFSTIVTVCALDQVIKAVVVAHQTPGDSFRVIPGLSITHVRNTGAAFGLFAGSGQIIFWVALAIVVLALLWFFRSQDMESSWFYVGIGLLVGGALGNLIDRVFRDGLVVDYIDFGWWPVFNVADIAIVLGVILLMVLLAVDLRRESAGGSHEKKD